MAKKTNKPTSPAAVKPEHGSKSAAIREYLNANKDARPKDIVAALKEQGIEVSPNMVSIIKAKAGIKSSRRTSGSENLATANGEHSSGLEAALLLYKAARGQNVPQKQVSNAFLSLVEVLS